MMDSMVWSVGYEGEFALNEFNQPKISSEIEVVLKVVLFVLFSKPGNYPSLPTIGMDISSRLYNTYNELRPDDLQNELTTQCAALGVYFQSGAIQFRKEKYRGKPSLLIRISGEERYPKGYLRDTVQSSSVYMIGITYDDLNRMIYNIGSRPGGE